LYSILDKVLSTCTQKASVKLKNEDKYNKKKNKYNRIFGLRYPTHTETNSIFIQVRQRNGRL